MINLTDDKKIHHTFTAIIASYLIIELSNSYSTKLIIRIFQKIHYVYISEEQLSLSGDWLHLPKLKKDKLTNNNLN